MLYCFVVIFINNNISASNVCKHILLYNIEFQSRVTERIDKKDSYPIVFEYFIKTALWCTTEH